MQLTKEQKDIFVVYLQRTLAELSPCSHCPGGSFISSALEYQVLSRTQLWQLTCLFCRQTAGLDEETKRCPCTELGLLALKRGREFIKTYKNKKGEKP